MSSQSKTARAASVLKVGKIYGDHMAALALLSNAVLVACIYLLQSGAVLGGTAILSAMNSITPHMAGAVDIMVVEQPDGTLKCSPFYGKCKFNFCPV
jgi:hypothetical protein